MAIVSFMSGALDSAVTLARNSPATYRAQSGLIATAAANQARFDYAGGVLRGLLIEAASSNALFPSNDPSAVFNGSFGSTFTANDRVAPDGTTSAMRVDVTASGRISGGLSISGQQTASIWVYQTAPSPLNFGFYDGGGGNGSTSATTPPANAWTRLERSALMTGNDRRLWFLETGTAYTVWLWQPQDEPGVAQASTNIFTTTAAANRAADVVTINWGQKGVANGNWTVRYTFADGTTQDVATTVAGGTATVPGNLSRNTVQQAELFDTIIISPGTAPTATTAGVSIMGASGTLEYQVSSRRDFAYCVCPIYSTAATDNLQIVGLNQRATYYVRVRTRTAGVATVWSNVISIRTADGVAQVTTPAGVMIAPAMMVTPEVPITAVGGATVPGFPALNVFRDSPVGWKASIAGGTQNFDAQFAGQSIDTIAVMNTNAPEAATVQIYAAPTKAGLDSGTGRVLLFNGAFRASVNLPGRPGYHGIFQFTATTLPWIRIAFLGTFTGDLIYVEHIVYGRNRATKNHSVDKTETPTPRATIDRSRGGVADRVQGLPMRKVDFELQMLTEAQYETIYGDLWRRENDTIFVLPNSLAGAFRHDRMVYGDLTGGRIVNPVSPRYSRQFSVNSLI